MKIKKYVEELGHHSSPNRDHIVEMLDKIPELECELKQCRWLGFVQGWMWAVSMYTIDEMKIHNHGLYRNKKATNEIRGWRYG